MVLTVPRGNPVPTVLTVLTALKVRRDLQVPTVLTALRVRRDLRVPTAPRVRRVFPGLTAPRGRKARPVPTALHPASLARRSDA